RGDVPRGGRLPPGRPARGAGHRLPRSARRAGRAAPAAAELRRGGRPAGAGGGPPALRRALPPRRATLRRRRRGAAAFLRLRDAADRRRGARSAPARREGGAPVTIRPIVCFWAPLS